MASFNTPTVSSIYSPPVNRLEPETRDYVAGDDCQVFVNDVYLDQVAMLQYQLVNTRRPVYGYHSPFLDGMLHGHELVYGRLSIYKIVDNYLRRLSSHAAGHLGNRRELFEQSEDQPAHHFFAASAPIADPDPILIPFFEAIIGQASFQTYLSILKKLKSHPIPGVLADLTTQARTRSFLTDQAIEYKKMLLNRVTQIYGSLDQFQKMMFQSNAFKHRFAHLNPTGISSGDLALSGDPKILNDLFLTPFDLTVFMGVMVTRENRQKDYAIATRMEDVHITGNSSAHETSGSPIITSYDFIAQRYTEAHVTE